MKDFWNKRYSESGLAYGEGPNVFLAEVAGQIKAHGKVLVVGDGEGRNGLWLAKQGFIVTSVDYSEVAIEKIDKLAENAGVHVNTVCVDLNHWEWPLNAFDAVVSIYLHFSSTSRPVMHQKMLEALVHGGKIIIEAFNKTQLAYPSGGPQVQDMLFSKAELAEDFSALQIQLLEEKVVQLSEGKYHAGEGAVVRLIGEKK